MSRLICLALLPLLSAPAVAAPCDPLPEHRLSAVDTSRLASLTESRERGLRAARAGGGSEAAAILDPLFAAGVEPVRSLPTGPYRCRTIKLGGPFGSFTAYGFFRCRVRGEPGSQIIEKVSGSQRFSGDLLPADGGLVFRGADHYGDERPRAYDDDPERNSVACLGRSGGGSWILEFPMPFLESDHDVIELRPE